MTTPLDISTFVYNTGTLTIAPGDTTATITDTPPLSFAIKPGDYLFAGGSLAVIETVTDEVSADKHLGLFTEWAGDAVTAGSYVIIKASIARYDSVLAAYETNRFLSLLNDTLVFYVVTGDEPDPSIGEEGQFALKTNAAPWKLWIKTAAVWVLQAGSPGGDGEPGEAATITVGTVTAVAAGSPATVTNSGTANAAVLDFEIPAGAPGADGEDGLGVPSGGTTGQVLAKTSDTDNDTEWVDPPAGGGDVAGDTHAAASKTTPVDADELPLVDSYASNVLKKLTWANLKATLAAWLMSAGWIREKLTANRTYYVRTDGSDTNNGLANTSGGAFKTIQKAYDVIAGTIDLGGFTVTIQIADGTYAPTSGTSALNISQPWTGGGQVIIQGNSGTPANVLLSTTSADTILVTTTLPGVLTIKDLKLAAATNGNGLNNSGVGTVNFQNINFGAIAYYGAAAVGTGSVMVATGSYAISGGGLGHILAASGGFMFTENLTITITGTPAYSFAYVSAKSLGGYIADGITFSGTGATGKRYDVSLNSIINTVSGANATYFPGSAPGTSASGGQYL